MPAEPTRFVSSDEPTQDMPRATSGGETEPRTDGAAAQTMPLSPDSVPAADGEPLPAFVGRHRVCQRLGEGTFGTVFRCYDEQLRRNVAIKLPHASNAPSAERLQAFLHEAQSAARLTHPGIVSVLDIGETDDGRGFIVYEFIDGETLRSRIQRRDYTVDQAVEWTIATADALHYAHKQGLVHRDIKPANVLVDHAGRAHLTDFGLAKLDDHYFTDDAGRVLGTVSYMSPEQARGQSHWASPQSDVYSLGVLFYQLLTGRLPFSAESTLDLLDQVEHRDPPPPRTIDDSIPRELEAICLRALAKKASDRYTTTADMAADLRREIRSRSGASPVRSVAAPALMAAVVGFSVLGIWYLAQSSSPTVPAALPAAPPAATTPTLSIVLQRAWEDSQHKLLELNDLPLRDGDRVQFHAVLPKPAYAYIYWYDADGNPKRIFPEDGVDAQGVEAKSEIWSPAESNAGEKVTYWPVEGRAGTEVALLAISDRRLSAAELAEFDARHLSLSGQLSRSGALVEISSRPQEGATRGLGPKVVSGKTGLASDFQRELTAKFREYHGWALTHE